MKVVINRCYGGFGLSEAAVRRYAEIKGLDIFPEKDERFQIITTYWTVPPDPERETQKDWDTLDQAGRSASNERIRSQQIDDLDMERNDPVLVQVVEELGKAASGKYAELRVVEIPDGVEYEIDEYDGIEHIAETHRTWS